MSSQVRSLRLPRSNWVLELLPRSTRRRGNPASHQIVRCCSYDLLLCACRWITGASLLESARALTVGCSPASFICSYPHFVKLYLTGFACSGTNNAQVAAARTTGFARAAGTSTSPSAPPATCAAATSPGPWSTRYYCYLGVLLIVVDSSNGLAVCLICVLLAGRLH